MTNVLGDHPDSDRANETAKQVLEILRAKATTPLMHPHTAVLLIEWAIAWDPGDPELGKEASWNIRARVALPHTLVVLVPFSEEVFEGAMSAQDIATATMGVVTGELIDMKTELDRVMQAVEQWSAT